MVVPVYLYNLYFTSTGGKIIFCLFYVHIQGHGIKEVILDNQVLYLPVTATTSYNPLCKYIYSILKVAYLSQFSFVLTASGHLLIVLIFSLKSAAVFPFLGNCLLSWAALNPHRISCDCGKQPSPASQSLIYQADCTRPTFDSPLGEVTAPLSIPVHHFSSAFFFFPYGWPRLQSDGSKRTLKIKLPFILKIFGMHCRPAFINVARDL